LAILKDPGALDKLAPRMVNIRRRLPLGYSKRNLGLGGHLMGFTAGKILDTREIQGSFLKKLLFLQDTIEFNVHYREWELITNFDVDYHNLRYAIEFNPEVLETILPLFRSYMDIEVVGHSTPKGIIELPIGIGRNERPGPVYATSGMRGFYVDTHTPSEYVISNKSQLIAAAGAMYSYLHMSKHLSELGIINGSRLIDMCLRTGIYGTNTLKDILIMLPIFSRFGLAPALYHLSLARDKRIEALELFIFRLWIFLSYVRQLHEAGVSNLGATSSYTFQGRTPATEDYLQSTLLHGLHPLEPPISGLVDYFYPPACSADLLYGQFYLCSKDGKKVNTLQTAAELRKSVPRNQVVFMNDFDLDMPNTVDESVDYVTVAPVPNARTQLYRELYGGPVDFDEHVIKGIISAPYTNGSHGDLAPGNIFMTARDIVEVQLGLIDTLLIGGQPLCTFDKLYKPVHPTYLCNYVSHDEYAQLRDKQERAYYDYTQKRQRMFGELVSILLTEKASSKVKAQVASIRTRFKDILPADWKGVDMASDPLAMMRAFLDDMMNKFTAFAPRSAPKEVTPSA